MLSFIRRAAAVCLAALLLTCLPSIAPAQDQPAEAIPGEGLAGNWLGTLDVGVAKLRLGLEVTQNDDGSLAANMDSLDQGAMDIPVNVVTFNKPAVHLELKTIGGQYDGTMTDDGSQITGTWQQGGQSMPLTFNRVTEAPQPARRPQDPVPPFPYHGHDITFENTADGVTLAGTFTIPEGPGPFPAVVLISGSGPQNRDEELMGHRPFLVLTDHLCRHGIAVLRFDDRGVAKSGGDLETATHETAVRDVLAAVAYLKTGARIDTNRIGLIGHSEGGVVAPLAAVQSPDDVAFIVLMAGPGVPMDQLLQRQQRDLMSLMTADSRILDNQQRIQRLVLDIVISDDAPEQGRQKIRPLMQEAMADFTPDQLKQFGFTPETAEAQIDVVLTPWFRTLMRYDPRPTLQQVKCPVLAINGEKDIQVAADENLNAIRDALAAGGNTDVTIIKSPGLNHLFQQCETGAIAEYGQIEETFNPTALNAISDWIGKTVGLEQPQTTE